MNNNENVTCENVNEVKEKPQIHFSKIVFNDGTELELQKNSIVVFTGANNSGKTQVLKDIDIYLNSSNHRLPIVIKEADPIYSGAIDEEKFFREHFKLNEQEGMYLLIGTQYLFAMNYLKECWTNHTFYNNLHNAFVHPLTTEMRLNSLNALLFRNYDYAEGNPIYKLSRNERLAQDISDYFRKAFGVDLVVNRNELRNIPLHIGQAPDKTEFTIAEQDDYYNLVAELPMLQEQGDGMRSFASILLNTFTSSYPIVLIDEPEAFLHPPHARILGEMLSKNNPEDRQLFISTHSDDFLKGLLDSDTQNVTIIRINRQNDINKISILQHDKIKKFWSNPILRYSNILSGLFHKKVIVCESDYDCLFYQAIMNAICELKNEIAPDILFTHCSGKSRIKHIVRSLKAIDVPVVAISDFDLLSKEAELKSLISAFVENWETTIEKDIKIFYDSINAKKSCNNDVWEQIKKIGKTWFRGDAFIAYENIEKFCKSIGLFIVPVGEMECFYRATNKEKKDWVYEVLENYNLANEPKLEDARKFIEEIIKFGEES